MYHPFFEKDISDLGSDKLKALKVEEAEIVWKIRDIESQLYLENDMEENQKDYLTIGELEKDLSDLKIRLNTLREEIDQLETE